MRFVTDQPVRALLVRSLALAALAQGVARAQDLEPRRWTHMPIGMSVAGLTYGYTDGNVGFDPLLQVQDATVQVHTLLASYTHAFDLAGKTGRIDVIVPYQSARWDGLLAGTPTSVNREGLSDPWVRFSVGLAGAPALKGAEFGKYRATHSENTVVGAALGLSLPLGQYESDKLLNLGQNRFVIRPQVGVLHTQGPWALELTGSVFFFTDNDEFFGGNERSQDPTLAAQTHLIRSFQDKSWVSASIGYGLGGESKINGVPKGDDRGDLLWAVSGGLPLFKTQGLKLTYLRNDNRTQTGSDTQNLLLTWNLRF